MSNFKIKNRQLDHVSPVNNNILINSNFANPVNQRGATSHSSEGYFIDRWTQYIDYGTISLGDEGLIFDALSLPISLGQKIEFPEKYSNITMTFSICVKRLTEETRGMIYIGLDGVNAESTMNNTKVGEFEVISTTFNLSIESGKIFTPAIYLNKGKAIVKWAKLELGDVATPYVPRLYAEELELCKWYWRKKHVNTANVYAMNDTTILLADTVGHMRIDNPTVTYELRQVTVNNVVVDGFTPSLAYIKTSNELFCTGVVKPNHGLNYTDIICMDCIATIDAEL